MFIKENNNPQKKRVDDCVIRAISKILNQTWKQTYIELAVKGFEMADLQSADEVWNTYLYDKGLKKYIIPNNCPKCTTVSEFLQMTPKGKYLLFVGGHVVAAINGNYYDTWDSGDRTIIYYFAK